MDDFELIGDYDNNDILKDYISIEMQTDDIIQQPILLPKWQSKLLEMLARGDNVLNWVYDGNKFYAIYSGIVASKDDIDIHLKKINFPYTRGCYI
jgi:hypothetical protein